MWWDKTLELLWGKALELLVSTIGQSAVDAWRMSSDVDSDLSNLRATLTNARLLIERSECWRLAKYKPIDELLYQLKDSVYEAESIVDELEYQRLKKKVEKSSPGISNILTNWMSDFPTTVKGVFDRLNRVYDVMKENCDRHHIPENPNQFSQSARPITSTILDTPNVYGRDKEFNKVIRLMGVPSSGSRLRKRARKLSVSNLDVGESSSRMDKKHNVSVLSIVGLGGVGKTTLAQLVCNDKSVMSYFDLIMWVCVSDNFDLVRLTREIIESATKLECKLTNLHALQVTLQETLNSKRFLLVLDDVWSKDWQRLLAPMKRASEGGVVLVTTRSLECVEIPSTSTGSTDVINLEGLEEDIYWEFFKSCAFDPIVESNNINPELEFIGQEICKKLKGSPLAAKTIGGLLRTNLDVRHWENIKDSKMWQLQKEEHDILPVLQLSYQYLPSHLKKCFSFCSLYPKDFKFTQSELTMFWIMQGLIQPLDNIEQLRNLAEGYFLDLGRRCFFQIYARGTEYKYVIHDLMHDVCQSITKDECFCLENGHSEQKVSPDIRHVSDFRKKLVREEQKELRKYKKLLSLKVTLTNRYFNAAIENWCNELTNIRSLSLARCKKIKKLPENIGNLKHLQCFDISGTNIKTLPESFCCLYNLQCLNMNNCSYIECFPEGLNDLVNLLFLSLPLEKLSLVAHMKNICKAIQIHDVCIEVPRLKIENLKNFCKLSGSLTIYGLKNVPSKKAAEKAQLNNKPLVNSLHFDWESQDKGHTGGQSSNEHPDKEASTISHLPRFITSLSIRGCTQLKNLQKCLVPKNLPVLKDIDISFCRELKSLPLESFEGFVSLEWLTIVSCPKLRSLNAVVLPPSVKHLELVLCGDLEKSIPSCLRNLTSLEKLSIGDCQSLVSIPAEVTSNLKYLSELYFEGCRNLQSLGGLQFLASLPKVTIRNCPKLDETRGQDIYGKLPSELLKDMPSSSQDRKRRTRRA